MVVIGFSMCNVLVVNLDDFFVIISVYMLKRNFGIFEKFFVFKVLYLGGVFFV